VPLRDAYFAPAELVLSDRAVRRVSADALAAHPPAIPNVLPGELITAEARDFLRLTAAARSGTCAGPPTPSSAGYASTRWRACDRDRNRARARPVGFRGLLAGWHPTAFRLRRRFAALFTARLRDQLKHLAVSLGGDAPGRQPKMGRRVSSCGVRRAAHSSRKGRIPPPNYLTINGAVEKVSVRGNRRIRVRLVGPGLAFGYESLIDGQASPVAAITRERAILLILPCDVFDRLFSNEDAFSRVFLEAIHRDLLATLRQTLRPRARLTESV
jgi:hypothetical protein